MAIVKMFTQLTIVMLIILRMKVSQSKGKVAFMILLLFGNPQSRWLWAFFFAARHPKI